MKDDRAIISEFRDRFAEELVDRRFLAMEYAALVFSLEGDHAKGTYRLQLEADSKTRRHNDEHLPPVCKTKGWELQISFKTYCRHAFGRGGYLCKWQSIVDEHFEHVKARTTAAFTSHLELDVYAEGYSVDGVRFVVMLLFDPASATDHNFENQIMAITIDPTLTRAVDRYHKEHIFSDDYIESVRNYVDQSVFEPFHSSLVQIAKESKFSSYLFRLYYDFLFANLTGFSGQLTSHQLESLIALSREFERNQRNLFRVPHYRDHFLHQCNVYILGVALISICKNTFDFNMIDIFKTAYRAFQPNEEYHKYDEVGIIWFLASMYHDIAYPIQNFSGWLDAFMIHYIRPTASSDAVVDATLRMDRIVGDHSYGSLIEDLSDYQRRLLMADPSQPIQYRKLGPANESVDRACCLRSLFVGEMLRQRDHGILSALMLLDALGREWSGNRYLYPAASAISLHNFMWVSRNGQEIPCRKCQKIACASCDKWIESTDRYFDEWQESASDQLSKEQIWSMKLISFKKNPVAFLLILCDLLQDWGRQDPSSSSNLLTHHFNPAYLHSIVCQESSRILFRVKIRKSLLSDGTQVREFRRRKMQEIAQVFSRIEFEPGKDLMIELSAPGFKSVLFSLNVFRGKRPTAAE